MANDESILVGLATYNEIDTLPSLVETIHAEIPQASVLVVDDNSPDGTGAWCQETAASEAWFTCLNRPGKLGLGSALRTLMQTAVERDYHSLVTLDADWSHPPSALPKLIEASKQADVIIGSRYCPGGEIEGWPRRRRLASSAVNFASRFVLGVSVQDCSGNYRLYKTDLLCKLPWEELDNDGYAFIEEVLWHLHLLGASFAEVPITFTDRTAGESKINLGEMLGAAKTLTRLAIKRGQRILSR